MKTNNKAEAIDLIRFSPGGISRVDLARKMGLTRAAITSIIHRLMRENLVREARLRAVPSGRKPVILEINPGQGWVAGIDLGTTGVGVVVTDFSARVIEELEAPINIWEEPQECLGKVDRLLRELLQSTGLQMDQVSGIGVAIPGPAVLLDGIIGSAPLMPGWEGYPLEAHLRQAWNRPVALGSDLAFGALAEWAYGAGRGERSLVFVRVDAGVGACLLVEGQVYRGSSGNAGQIGHTVIDPAGPECACGNRGCLEMFASSRALIKIAADAVQKGMRTQLSTIDPPTNITIQEVISAAQSGDLLAQQILTAAGASLGPVIAGLVNAFDPGAVVIGGNVALSGDLVLEPLRQAIRERSYPTISKTLRISAALLGKRSARIGAAVQAISRALHGDPGDH